MAPYKRPTSIIGLSDQFKIPSLGYIRLGIKEANKSGDGKHPVNLNHFIVPKQVEAVFGPNPAELRIIFPLNKREEFFQQSCVMWGNNTGILCEGDGEVGRYYDKEKMDFCERDCWNKGCKFSHTIEHEKDKNATCRTTGVLSYMIPEVSIGGVFTTVTHSATAIKRINSQLLVTLNQVERLALVPFILYRTDVTYYPKQEKRIQSIVVIRPNYDQDMPKLEDIKRKNKEVLNRLIHTRLALPVPDVKELAADDIIDADPVQQIAAPVGVAPEPQPVVPEIIPETAPAPEPPKEPAPAPPPAPKAEPTKAEADEIQGRHRRLLELKIEFRKKHGAAQGDKAFALAVGDMKSIAERLKNKSEAVKMFSYIEKKLAE